MLRTCVARKFNKDATTGAGADSSSSLSGGGGGGGGAESESTILPTRIYTHKADVDHLNARELAALPSSSEELYSYRGDINNSSTQQHAACSGRGVQSYTAIDSGSAAYLALIQTHCPAKQQLQLKTGAQVILVKTIDAPSGLVNGARGVVSKFTAASRRPVVKFSNGVERTIGLELFGVSLGGRVVAQRQQIPLDLAWAISCHKAQGISVDRAILHLKHVFEYGQAYVALSRCRTLAGLSLESRLEPAQVKAHPSVVRFYRQLMMGGQIDG